MRMFELLILSSRRTREIPDSDISSNYLDLVFILSSCLQLYIRQILYFLGKYLIIYQASLGKACDCTRMHCYPPPELLGVLYSHARITNNLFLLLQFFCGTPAVFLQYSYSSPAFLLQYSCSTHALLLHYSCSSSAVLLQFSCRTPAVLLHFFCGIPAVFLQYSCSSPA